MELYEYIEAGNFNKFKDIFFKDRGLNPAGLKNKKYTKIELLFWKK